ncbi:conserved hypothetical protein [Chloroherpeton thalassium ATCC 35110]|uniref:YhcH/YjgK/YiaL family protein n=1 Tax=Chloroherpeton thalassium (strain ATCC 35110 / GB-78) TaxID=517418 RepID=B3QT83_CHLT3|nr:YhcH/YjgK/YiaL family protein [Chloroherpeton thalassium]ACF14182.1 conserved hypothetical protein [Chloroherpeton thalassium ATCC 35110]
MIIDQLEKGKFYPYGSAWQKALEFLASLTPDSEEKKYDLMGDDLFAQVVGYQTRTKETAVLEAHRKYVDVHVLISGRERLEVISTDGLEVDKAYDESKDAELYKHTPGHTLIDLYPGNFALFFPHDAHMPSLTMGEHPESVKKVVIKIKTDLLLTA